MRFEEPVPLEKQEEQETDRVAGKGIEPDPIGTDLVEQDVGADPQSRAGPHGYHDQDQGAEDLGEVFPSENRSLHHCAFRVRPVFAAT